MSIEVTTRLDINISCASCDAYCCRLEVMLITDAGVPNEFIEVDMWGGMTMERLVGRFGRPTYPPVIEPG